MDFQRSLDRCVKSIECDFEAESMSLCVMNFNVYYIAMGL